MNRPAGLPIPDSDFFKRLKNAAHKLLLLDYDGTLSPFVEDRFKAVPYPGVPNLLYDILAKPSASVVIVTGRPIQEILPLLDMNPHPEIWGSHGWQHLRSDGTIENFPLPQDVQAILETVQTGFQASIPLEKIDVKPGSVAVHWRGLPEDMRVRFSELARTICAPYSDHIGLELQAFDGGLELRVKGRDKGTSVSAILEQVPPQTFSAFLGDDKTDEDAFAALAGKGEGILVRQEFRPTAAHWQLLPPDELLAFLAQWRDTI